MKPSTVYRHINNIYNEGKGTKEIASNQSL